MSDTLPEVIGKLPHAVQVIAALVFGAVSAVLWFFGARRRRPSGSDDDDQKLRDELLGHRLRNELQVVLEAHRVSVTASLEDHKREIREELEDHKRALREELTALHERLRIAELSIARLPQGRSR